MYSLAGHWLFVGIMTTKMTHFASDDDDKNKGYKPQEGKDDDKDGEPHIENDAEAPAPVAKDDDDKDKGYKPQAFAGEKPRL